jgi:hypothetical protein
VEGKRLTTLWWITGLIALILLIATAGLFLRAEQIEESGIVAYVTSSQSAPFLRDQPSNTGAVLMVLDIGSPVRIKDSATRSNIDWYFVNIGDRSGWLRASLISFDPP